MIWSKAWVLLKIWCSFAKDKIKGKEKRADIDAFYNLIVQADAKNIGKYTIKNFVTQLVTH